MKKLLLSSCCTVVQFICFSQHHPAISYLTPTGTTYVKSPITTGTSQGQYIAHDSHEHIIVMGEFTGRLTWGRHSLTAITGDRNVFVAKFTTGGECIWAKQFTGIFIESVGLVCDKLDNIYLGVSSANDITINGNRLIHTAGSVNESVLISLSPVGKVRWYNRITATKDAFDLDLAINSKSEIICTGAFSGNALIHSQDGLHRPMTGGIELRTWVCSFSSVGKIQWVFTSDGAYEKGAKVAVDKTDNIFVTGFYQHRTTFGPYTLTGTTDANMCYIVKFNPLGTPLWLVGNSSNNRVYPTGIVCDSKGNAIIMGTFNTTVNFGSTHADSRGAQDIFIVKVAGSGEFSNLSVFGGIDGEASGTITVTYQDVLLLTGGYRGTAFFNSLPESHMSTGITANDLFIAALSAIDLSLFWFQQSEDTGNQYGVDVTTFKGRVRSEEFIAVTGDFYTRLTFDRATIRGDGLESFLITAWYPSGLLRPR